MSHFAAELAAARSAQPRWAALPVRDRLRPARALRRLLVSRADAITAAVRADVGRPPDEVLATDLLPTAAALKYLEREAARVLAPRRVSGRLRPTWLMGCRDIVHRRPWGVVGVIGTWNYPVYLNAGQAAQALVAGNAVLWKPSENAARTADLTHALFLDAGFPADLFHQLPATREAGPQLADTDVDYVVFTGSDAVGRRLAARLGERLVPSTLELSGCDAMFVLADADVGLAAKAAWFGVTLNRGQTCIAVRRVFVHRGAAAAFADELRKLAAAAVPVELVTEAQRHQAERLIADAVARGATPLANPDRQGGGDVTPSLTVGVRLQPTFLLDAPADAAVCREACFAPVAAVIPFDTVDDAVSRAAGSPFGLGASVFTADAAAARDLAARLPAGSVSVNDVLAPTAHPATPFGGRGASGWGVTQGAEGLLGMTVPQVVTVRRGRFRPHLDEAAKPDPATGEFLRGLLRWTHGRGLREKLGGLWQMVRGARRKRRG
ncbi:MAG: aldehyde dehydrogenase [Isosphaera sp.]|nr:aldehyde dehydrogenase [Isosphaera sp.]